MENNNNVRYLKQNKFTLNTYAFESVGNIEKKTFVNKLWSQPSSSSSIIQNYKKNNLEKLNLLYKNTIFLKTFLGVILGGKGGGKTGTAYYLGYKFWLEGFDEKKRELINDLIENDLYDPKIHGESKNKVFIYVVSGTPIWLETCYDITKLPDGCMLIIDEGAIFNNSRDSGSGSGTIGVVGLLPILRHRDLKILIISQQSILIDINFFRTNDFIIAKKQISPEKDERSIWNDLDLGFIKRLKDPSTLYFKSLSETIVFTVDTPLCPHYERYSKSFRKFILPQEESKAIAMIESLLKFTEFGPKAIYNIMNIWGYNKSLKYYTDLKKDFES